MTKRLKAAERRATILAVAKVLFADKGYHGVSVDEIAKRLGVSPAVLYQHFPSKEALYESVLNEISEKRESYVDTILTEPSDFKSVLLGMTQLFANSISRDPDYLRMELMSALEDAPAAQHFFENRWRSFADYIEVGLKELAAEGRASHVNPKAASLMFQGMIREVLYVKCIQGNERYKGMPLDSLLKQMVDLFLAATGYKQAA